MPSQTRTPGTVVSLGSGIAWVSPENAAAEDGNLAAATFPALSVDTDTAYLYASNFGFSVTDGASVDGFIARSKRRQSAPGVVDLTVSLVRAGTIVGENKAKPGQWPLVLGFESYGAADDTWLVDWIASLVNDPTTGLVISARNTIGGEVALVDLLELTVFFTGGAAHELTAGIVGFSAEAGEVGPVSATGALHRPSHEGLVGPELVTGGITPRTHEGRIIRRT
jgi:hypothetical protein